MTQVINIKDAPSGWRNDPEYVYIGRGSKWGNPFPITPSEDRETVIRRFKQYLTWEFDLYNDTVELKGKTLVCFCAPQACHGDVLAAVADGDLVLFPWVTRPEPSGESPSG